MRVLAVAIPAVQAWALVHLGRTHEPAVAVPHWLADDDEDTYQLAFWARPYRHRDAAVKDARALARVAPWEGCQPRQRGGVWSYRQGLVVHRLDLDRLPEGRFVAVGRRDRCLDLTELRPLVGPDYTWPSSGRHPAPPHWLAPELAAQLLGQLGVERGTLDFGQLDLLGGVRQLGGAA